MSWQKRLVLRCFLKVSGFTVSNFFRRLFHTRGLATENHRYGIYEARDLVQNRPLWRPRCTLLVVHAAVGSCMYGCYQVNWTPKLLRETLMEGRLPDVRLPLLVDDTKYCQVSFTDNKSTVEFGFHAKYESLYDVMGKCWFETGVDEGSLIGTAGVTVVITEMIAHDFLSICAVFPTFYPAQPQVTLEKNAG